ncbi:transcription termination/antitermination protein NusG [Desulfonatronovibrio magnus]|uniref:transcription termination/antitermination protein NusG n=1 Tax=Desulfonatronovibrio magnus TaxID=698827 RepID=UPI0005EAF89F|nr:transcription termination/antitermination protein NusG [Desulfonatronovibrio magnus]
MEETAPKPRWYIVHTYSGYEQRVEKTVREMMRTGQDKGFFEEIVVPTEKVVELVKGQKKTSTRKFFPGYVLIKMLLNNDSWHLIHSIPKVTGFIGNKNKPTPLTDKEAEKILTTVESRKEQPRPKFHFARGDEIRVIDGPFANFNGIVEDVNYDKGKLKVSVSIFGRQTPVELDFVQVSKS